VDGRLRPNPKRPSELSLVPTTLAGVTRRQEVLGMGVSCSGRTPASTSNGFPGVDGGVALGDGTSLKRGGDKRKRDETPFSLAASSER